MSKVRRPSTVYVRGDDFARGDTGLHEGGKPLQKAVYCIHALDVADSDSHEYNQIEVTGDRGLRERLLDFLRSEEEES